MSNTQKISAILPCFNHAKFLEERVNSVLSQSHPVDQIIFLDDASSDHSAELARRLLSRCSIDVEFHFNRENSGSPFAQWNKGIERAKHDLIWIAETDDCCHPNLLSSLFQALEATSSGIAFSDSLIIGEDGQSDKKFTDYLPPDFKELFQKDAVFSSLVFTKWLSVINLIPNASAVLFSRDLYIQTGGAPPFFRYVGDWLTWLKIANISDIAYVSSPYNFYRDHHSVSRRHFNTNQYILETFEARLAASQSEKNNYMATSYLGTPEKGIQPADPFFRSPYLGPAAFLRFAYFCSRSSKGLDLLLGILPPRLCLSLPLTHSRAIANKRLFAYSPIFILLLFLTISTLIVSKSIFYLLCNIYKSSSGRLLSTS